MNVEVFKSLTMVVLLSGSAVLLGWGIGLWIRRKSSGEGRVLRKVKPTIAAKGFVVRQTSQGTFPNQKHSRLRHNGSVYNQGMK